MRSHSFQWFLGSVSFVSASELSQAANYQATPINIVDLVAGEIAAPDEADTFEFDAITGQVVFLDRTASSNPNGPNWKLEDRFGHLVIDATR